MRLLLSSFVLILLAVFKGMAQEPADLSEARQALLNKALTDSQKVTEQYVLALAARDLGTARRDTGAWAGDVGSGR